MSAHHYKTLAKWVKEIGLVSLATLVIQKIFLGTPLGDPVVVTGAMVSLLIYLSATYLLLKS